MGRHGWSGSYSIMKIKLKWSTIPSIWRNPLSHRVLEQQNITTCKDGNTCHWYGQVQLWDGIILVNGIASLYFLRDERT
jgi:hypothetical protein